MNPSVNELAEKLTALAAGMQPYRQAMIDDLVALCRIPSVRGDAAPGAPYGPATLEALEWFLRAGERLGFNSVNLDGHAGYVEWGEGPRLIAAICHLDVVPAGDGWRHDPFEPVIRNGRIIARGTSDDKGPAIAVLYAMKALADSGWQPGARIRLIVGLDEESGMDCMRHYVKTAEQPDAGFTADADFPVIHAEKGVLWLRLTQTDDAATSTRLIRGQAGERPNMVPALCRLTFARTADDDRGTQRLYEGVPAHASTPWDGRNAIDLAMTDAKHELDLAGETHPFVEFYQALFAGQIDGTSLGIAGHDASGPLTLNAGVLELDGSSASLAIDIRYPVTQNGEALLEQIRQACRPYHVNVEIINHMPPLHVEPDSFLVRSLTETYADLTGSYQAPIAIGGGTYARAMPNIVAFGPAFPGETMTAHQIDEQIIIDHWLAASAIYREALHRLAD